MLKKQPNSVITLALLFALVGTPKPATASFVAQANSSDSSFSVPDRVPKNTQISIAGSTSTQGMSQSLKESFEQKFPNAQVNLATQNTTAALKSLANGEADLAVIGRNLTPEEKQQGFQTVPLSREKIAIVVTKNNAFDGNLTIDQFAQIFRGDITDWSDLGGSPAPITFVDLPNTNDTRQAFANYPVFQEGEFTTGENAIKLEEDSVEAIAEKLDNNSISFAVANDIAKKDDLRAVTMHQTQPGDSRYPFSQPFSLVYQGTPNQAVQAFLGFATTDAGEQIIQARQGSTSSLASAAALGSTAAISDLADKKGVNADTANTPDGTANVEDGANTPDGTATVEGGANTPDGTATAEGGVNTPDGMTTAGAEGNVPDGSTTAENGSDTPDSMTTAGAEGDGTTGTATAQLEGEGNTPDGTTTAEGDATAGSEGNVPDGTVTAQLEGEGNTPDGTATATRR